MLLLLSATPPLGDEAKFLALLNLLDPTTHPLDDIAGFKAKLEQRRHAGRLLLSLDPDAPAIVLRQRSAEILRSFPDDPFVQEVAPRLIAATQDTKEDLPRLCSALKEHIADCYRIHQRVIRSRRADTEGWEFRPRGPAVENAPNLSHVREESDPAEEMERILSALEDWRFSAMEGTAADEAALARAASRYRDLLGALGIGANAFRLWLNKAEQTFEGEADILRALRAHAETYKDDDRINTMVESTRRLLKAIRTDTSHPKVVVFATLTDTASSFHKVACREIDAAKCYLLTEDNGGANAEILELFRGSPGSAVLIVDQSGEEGLNLSFADGIVHLDLPLSAGRLEQRIGRIDRYGRRLGVVRQRLLLPSDSDMSPWSAWYGLLANGFLIFNRSISDVQFLVEDLELQAFRTLLQNGPDSFVALAAEVRSRIEHERKSQDEQYALDRVALVEEPVEDFLKALEDAEIDENALECGVDRWLLEALQLRKLPFAWPNEDPFKLHVVKGTLIPRAPWQLETSCSG